MAQKWPQYRSKMVQDRLQDGSGWPKMVRNKSNKASSTFRTIHEDMPRPRVFPRFILPYKPNIISPGFGRPLGRGKGEGSPPRSPGNGPKIAPRRSNIDSKMAQDGPTWLEYNLKIASTTLITIHEDMTRQGHVIGSRRTPGQTA